MTRGAAVTAVTVPATERTPGVCGGRVRVAGTRIPVWLLVAFRQDGVPDARLLEFYPALALAHLAEAWWYYAGHQPEIDQDIRDQDDE